MTRLKTMWGAYEFGEAIARRGEHSVFKTNKETRIYLPSGLAEKAGEDKISAIIGQEFPEEKLRAIGYSVTKNDGFWVLILPSVKNPYKRANREFTAPKRIVMAIYKTANENMTGRTS